jgi:hypothetical protein
MIEESDRIHVSMFEQASTSDLTDEDYDDHCLILCAGIGIK